MITDAGLQLMFSWVGESILEAGELGEMVPLGPANFAVLRALIRREISIIYLKVYMLP